MARDLKLTATLTNGVSKEIDKIIKDLERTQQVTIKQDDIHNMLDAIISKRVEIILMQKLAQLNVRDLSDVRDEFKKISEFEPEEAIAH